MSKMPSEEDQIAALRSLQVIMFRAGVRSVPPIILSLGDTPFVPFGNVQIVYATGQGYDLWHDVNGEMVPFAFGLSPKSALDQAARKLIGSIFA